MKKQYFLTLFFYAFIAGTAFGQSTADIPHGQLSSFTFTESKIFPGTSRLVTVYVPARMDAAKPACLYVQQDGFNAGLKFELVMDTLIANKEMPATVGIFISPGTVTPPADNKTIRRPNRGFEYDGVGDRYARFVLDEIIPYVTTKYHLNISKNGNDHAIAGASSGGIAAFNAAWERPDAFSRVYCSSGSFVAFRGGNEFPTLVRKTAPKPIRFFMIAGTQDMENCAGDWTLINLEMEKALKFSGYDYQFHLKEGGHVTGWKEYFAGAMRYLWRDWPKPVMAGEGAPRVKDILAPGEQWKLLASGHKNIRGVASNTNGEVFFADSAGNKIYRVTTDGTISPFINNAGHCNSLSIGASGELYTASKVTGKIMRYGADGRLAVYAEGIKVEYILVAPEGGLYVTTSASAASPSKVWLVKGGKKLMVDEGLKSASGLAMAPDRWLLAVADRDSHWVYSYTIAPDGKLENKEPLFWLNVQAWDDDAGATSVCYDQEGHVYTATRSGVQVCTGDGPLQLIIPSPGERITAMCLGGKDKNILFAFCGDKIYQRKLNAHAVDAFTPHMSMPAGKL
jgi:gluconolactonase